MNHSRRKNKTCFVTTPIYYPSGNLHIGHLYSTTIAWAIKNYKLKRGYEVKFLTGSDEHGQKIAQSALKEKMDCQRYVDYQSQKFIDLWKIFGIEYDYFSRTTNEHHKKMVESIFNIMVKRGFIYKGVYRGLYSVSDEEFVTESQAIKEDKFYYHPVSKHRLEIIEEESYFFKMNEFSHWLINYIESNPNWIWPQKIVNELKANFLDQNLEDLSVTRISFEWGIQISNDPRHVIYVWLDALFNYISALGFDLQQPSLDFIKFWEQGDEIIHVVGKEITRFHCIYWPIFLKALNLKMPTKILAHGWIITPEGKMSKSKNNVINPLDLIEEFDPEVIKYYLLAKISIHNDGIFSKELLKNTYNSELANTIGNLISRTIAMIKKNFEQPVKFAQTDDQNDQTILKNIVEKTKAFQIHFDQFELDQAFEQMILLAKDLNKYIDLTTPWLLTNNPERLAIILNLLVNGIYAIATMLEIIMPNKVAVIKSILNIDSFNFDQIFNWDKFDQIIVNEAQPLFNRIS